ncbi:aminotransferase class I/II-fold pyridoxal phosphate-dependent enzyme [Imperialibacter roseus]|uniref:Aminotransferase class I/II-fold pyridoxal phosphate-dependent enzyme n=1 Tax=Imperialibacter roseus TaxID=1324217 RepID=A0ABZ0IMT9_9BACT|nr:aminotransferase class I/II-fold pyridoxal phosphate-dependent enzyme [Imperialibacter roseus]WOK06334.1 aminotransferase class I/II-fold pyridoxal phosphate-dependent enzyme [Imperialibacter roseus]
MNLDFQEKEFRQYTEQAVSIYFDWLKHLRGSKIYHNYTPAQIQERFNETLPEEETPMESLLASVGSDVFEMSNFNPSPNYYGYITGGGNQVGMLAEFLKAGLNQNNLKWHNAPANSEMEKIVIKWLCQFMGYPDDSAGVLVSGGSEGNFLHLAVMRKVMGPASLSEKGLYGQKPMTVYVSNQGHSSFDKAMDLLGMGKEYLRKIPVDDQFQVRVDLMEEAVQKDLNEGLLPIGVIGIAGSTNNGAIDKLNELATLAKKYKLWYMVDAAYGGPAAGTAVAGHLFRGMSEADAVLVNPHKWLYVPFQVAAVIVRKKEHLKNTFSLVPDYLRGGSKKTEREDLMDLTLQLTKDFKALKVWMTFKAYGAKKLRLAIENDIAVVRYFQGLVNASEDFEMLGPANLSIATFRYVSENDGIKSNQARVDAVNERILELIEEDGRIFFAGTRIDNRPALRINCNNYRRTKADIDFLLMVLRELGEKALLRSV